MSQELTPDQARAALDVIERSRTDVAGQIDVPTWYWWLLATGWVVLGVIADAGHALLTTIATLVFGAVHAGLCGRAISGRHGSNRLSVHASLAPRQLPAVVIGSLVVLTLVTIGAALAVDADGAAHPVTIASVFVAALVVLGGPQLVARVARRSSDPATPADA